jgi:hypothetical protein
VCDQTAFISAKKPLSAGKRVVAFLFKGCY